jgi:hypothetical protein
MLDKVHGKGKWEASPWSNETRTIEAANVSLPFSNRSFATRQVRGDFTLKETCSVYGLVVIESTSTLHASPHGTRVDITAKIDAPYLPKAVETWMLDSSQCAMGAIESFFVYN